MSFADRLQRLRKSKGLSQEDLAARLCVSRQSVSKWETGLAYPETEKLLALCEILGADLDYLLRDRLTESARESKVPSPFIPYLKTWVKIYLKDREFHGFYCVAIIEAGEEFLAFVDDRNSMGLLNSACIASITEADTHAYKALPNLADVPGDVLQTLPACFDGKLCTVRLRQEPGSSKQRALPGAYVTAIDANQITVCAQDGRRSTVFLSDVLYIQEQWFRGNALRAAAWRAESAPRAR